LAPLPGVVVTGVAAAIASLIGAMLLEKGAAVLSDWMGLSPRRVVAAGIVKPQ
jgi:hypothetical protein